MKQDAHLHCSKIIEVRCPVDEKQLKHRLEILFRDGHIGLRIGKRRYQMTRKSARSTNFIRWINSTSGIDKNGPINGLIISASKDQMDRIEEYFHRQIELGPPFRILSRNCSQEVCRALSYAELRAPHESIATIPRLTYRWLSIHSDVCEIRRYIV